MSTSDARRLCDQVEMCGCSGLMAGLCERCEVDMDAAHTIESLTRRVAELEADDDEPAPACYCKSCGCDLPLCNRSCDDCAD